MRGGFDKHLAGYFIADTGMLNQLVHIWKFADDNDRRAFWTRLRADKDFTEHFFSKFLPLLMSMKIEAADACVVGAPSLMVAAKKKNTGKRRSAEEGWVGASRKSRRLLRSC